MVSKEPERPGTRTVAGLADLLRASRLFPYLAQSRPVVESHTRLLLLFALVHLLCRLLRISLRRICTHIAQGARRASARSCRRRDPEPAVFSFFFPRFFFFFVGVTVSVACASDSSSSFPSACSCGEPAKVVGPVQRRCSLPGATDGFTSRAGLLLLLRRGCSVGPLSLRLTGFHAGESGSPCPRIPVTLTSC